MDLSALMQNPTIGAALGMVNAGSPSSTPNGINGMLSGALGGYQNSSLQGMLMKLLLQRSGGIGQPQNQSPQVSYGAGTNSLMSGLTYPQIMAISGGSQ
jgi:hypothetical protein